MSETSTATDVDRYVGDAIDGLSAAVTYVLSVVKWVILLNVGIGYTAFIGMIVRMHYLHGDILAVALTSLVYLVVPFVVVGRRFVRWKDSTDGDSGIAARVQNVV